MRALIINFTHILIYFPLYLFGIVIVFLILGFRNRCSALHQPESIFETHTIKQRVILVLTSGWFRASAMGYDLKIGEVGWERLVTTVQLWERASVGASSYLAFQHH